MWRPPLRTGAELSDLKLFVPQEGMVQADPTLPITYETGQADRARMRGLKSLKSEMPKPQCTSPRQAQTLGCRSRRKVCKDPVLEIAGHRLGSCGSLMAGPYLAAVPSPRTSLPTNLSATAHGCSFISTPLAVVVSR